MNLRLGGDHSLGASIVECAADGQPKPTIKWITPSGRTVEGETLDLGKVLEKGSSSGEGKSASSTYQCVAENGVGEALRKSITISFNGKGPFISKKKFPKR